MAVALLALPLAVGAAAPNIVLKDQDGKTRNVNEFIGHGKWTVVAVWSADCPICRREIHHMAFFHDEHKKSDAHVMGLSIDSEAGRAKALGFINDHGLSFPNLIGDPDVAAELGGGVFIGTPTFYVYSPEGKLAAQRVGPVTLGQMEDLLRQLRAKQAKSKAG
jgi:peroxiredoxin